MVSTLTLVIAFAACGQDAIPTSVNGPEQNALVSSVSVQPSAAVIAPDAAVDLSAIVRSARGRVVNGRPVSWVSSDERVAYVDGQGRIIAGEEGTATITANVLGVVGQATIDVRGIVTGIAIDDPLFNLVEGDSERLTATLIYENGARRPARDLRWWSLDPTRLWVDGEGEATGREVGEVEVRIRGRGKDGTRSIKVNSGSISSVTIKAGATSLDVGESMTVWADIRNSKGKQITKDVAWSSSDPATASIDASGTVRGIAAGTSTITGTVSGVSGTLDMTVTSGGGGGGGGATSSNPARVADFTIGQLEERRVELRFTEVDDGAGSPATYQVRYGLASGYSWNSAVIVQKGTCASPLAGTQVGATRRCWVDGLVAAEDYAFQIVAYRPGDETFGTPSSVVTARTQDAAILVDVTPSAFELETGASRDLNANITDSYGNEVEGTPTWTTTRSTVATVTSSGHSAAVSGQAAGEATIRASFAGVSGGASARIVEPAQEEGGGSGDGSTGGDTGGGSTGSGGTGAPPPPPAGQHFVGDFSSAVSDSDLQSMIHVNTTGNVHADPGIGMRYDYQPFPNRCGDQSLGASVPLPSGTQEVWMRFKIRFSGNWTTANPNCSSPAPDFKTVLTWLNNRNISAGHERFGLHFGENETRMSAFVPGYPQADVVPLGEVRKQGALQYFDNQWHTVEVHQRISGDNQATFQVRIDGQVTHNYTTVTASGLGTNWLSQVVIGANRNLGATSLMHIWWDDFEVWVGGDPGGFNFPPPTSY